MKTLAQYLTQGLRILAILHFSAALLAIVFSLNLAAYCLAVAGCIYTYLYLILTLPNNEQN